MEGLSLALGSTHSCYIQERKLRLGPLVSRLALGPFTGCSWDWKLSENGQFLFLRRIQTLLCWLTDKLKIPDY